VLIVGLLLSPVYTRPEILGILPEGQGLMQEGNSLLYLGLKYAIFGKILPTPAGEDVLIHAMAWAGWGGLLVTALNLMPVGQLDGGHVMYGLAGERAQMFRWPVIIALLLMSFLYEGWLLWVFLIFVLARRSAPVFDEITDLDATRRWIAVAMLVIFVLIFVPVPLKTVPLP
jgi:membrane-associated protease RseP (regulator of RpoE activity)